MVIISHPQMIKNNNVILPLSEKLGYVKGIEIEEEKTRRNRLFSLFNK